MAMKVMWTEVELGDELRTYHIGGDDGVDEITLDQQTLGIVVSMKDGTTIIYSHQCPYALCMEDVAEIITPKIEVVS